MSNNFDRGTAPLRLEYVAETSEGTTPTDPEWEGFSYNVNNYFNWEPDANTQTQRGAGEPKPRGFFNGSETHDATFEYDLARWIKDNSGNTQDPIADFLEISADNDVKATHTVVSRQDYSTGGSDGGGRRTYTVGKGGHPSTATLPYETSDGSPITVSLEYQFMKVRTYNIDQPSAGTTLDIVSTSANDTSQDITIEDEGANTSETLTLTGDTSVTTTSTFDDIDAVELSAETEGDITVSDGSGTEFLTIYGQNSYPAGEGDLGVPALGSGSHASDISEGNEVIFLDDTLDYDGTPIADEIESGELTVDLGINSNSQLGTAQQNIHLEEWSAEVTISVAGEDVTEKQMVDYLTETVNDIKWTAQQGSITLVDTRLTSPGEFVGEASDGKLMLDGTWAAEDITVSNEGA